MGFRPVAKVALIAASTVLLASEASAECYEVASEGPPQGQVRFLFCDDRPSFVRLSGKELAKHPGLEDQAAAGDIALVLQSPSTRIETVNDGFWGNGRAGYPVPLPSNEDALRLARAVNAGETITVDASHKSSGQTYRVFSGVFTATFPAAMLSGGGDEQPEKQAQAPAAPAAPAAPQQAQEKPYPVADLPSDLTSVRMIPFEAGQEQKWREEYLNSLGTYRGLLDRSCEAAAYPYRRSHSYWYHVESILERLNPRAPSQLTPDSAASLCADEAAAAAFRSELLAHPQNAFDRLCALMKSPAIYRDRNLLSVRAGEFETACYNLAWIRTDERDRCVRTYNPGINTLGKDELCDCMGDEVASFYADGTQKYSSKSRSRAHELARLECKGGAKAQQTSTPSLPAAKPAQPVQHKPAPANAGPDTAVEDLTEQAGDAIDEAADTIKKGLGSLFD